MEKKKKLPIGIEFFKDFKRDHFYYVDKTGFIRDLINRRGSVNLFTRPRRFGKSLNMNMLKTFFEIGTDPSFFEGLEIAAETELCEQYMGKFPVISISLKDVEGMDFQTAYDMLGIVVSEEAGHMVKAITKGSKEQNPSACSAGYRTAMHNLRSKKAGNLFSDSRPQYIDPQILLICPVLNPLLGSFPEKPLLFNGHFSPAYNIHPTPSLNICMLCHPSAKSADL